MKSFFIIRHPETEWNRRGLIQGHKDSPLTAAGRKSAVLVARKLRRLGIVKIYSSDLGRAMETAAIVQTATQAPVKAAKALREMDFGRAGGKTVPAARRLFDLNDPEARAPGGESFVAMQKRILRFVAAAMKREKAGVLIITHDGPLRALLAADRAETFSIKKFNTSARVVYRLKPERGGRFSLNAVK